jgi:hypothetical protein
MMWKQRRLKQVRPHSNAVVIACQQDKRKDHPYLLPLGGGQHYCHGVDYFLIDLTDQKGVMTRHFHNMAQI